MPRKSGSPTAKEAKELAKLKYEGFVRATDFVEVIDPEGATYQEHDMAPVLITPRGLEIIRFYADGGLGLMTIAERIGMTREQFTKAMRRQPEVAEILAQGKANEEFELKECLMNMARRGNVVAAIFMLKARHGWNDREQQGEQVNQKLQVIINAPLSTEDYKRLQEHNISPLHLPPPKTDDEYTGMQIITTPGEEVKTGVDQR
jgi:predicted DNA-binding protein (UPF0251 family)